MNNRNVTIRQKIYHKEIDKSQISGEASYLLNKNSYLKQIDNFYNLYIQSLHQKYKNWLLVFGVAWGFIGIVFFNFILQKNMDYKIPSIIQQVLNYGAAIALILIVFLGAKIIRTMADIKSNKNSKLRIAQLYKFTNPFAYKFYADGIVITEPHQCGTFEWTDFSKICAHGDFVVFTLKSHHSKGYEWTRGFMDLLIPVDVMLASKVDTSVFRDLKIFEEF